jgi:hypothetical protein
VWHPTCVVLKEVPDLVCERGIMAHGAYGRCRALVTAANVRDNKMYLFHDFATDAPYNLSNDSSLWDPFISSFYHVPSLPSPRTRRQ